MTTAEERDVSDR